MIILGVILHVIEVAVEKIDNILKDSVVVPLALLSASSDPTVRVWLALNDMCKTQNEASTPIILPAREDYESVFGATHYGVRAALNKLSEEKIIEIVNEEQPGFKHRLTILFHKRHLKINLTISEQTMTREMQETQTCTPSKVHETLLPPQAPGHPNGITLLHPLLRDIKNSCEKKDRHEMSIKNISDAELKEWSHGASDVDIAIAVLECEEFLDKNCDAVRSIVALYRARFRRVLGLSGLDPFRRGYQLPLEHREKLYKAFATSHQRACEFGPSETRCADDIEKLCQALKKGESVYKADLPIRLINAYPLAFVADRDHHNLYHVRLSPYHEVVRKKYGEWWLGMKERVKQMSFEKLLKEIAP